MRQQKPILVGDTLVNFYEACRQNLGCKCVNCGTTDNIQYHHIVPVGNGGANALSNVVPLCVSCHAAAHDKSAWKPGAWIPDNAQQRGYSSGKEQAIAFFRPSHA